MRERLQAFGGFMAGMVIPNIGAFIAWGVDHSPLHPNRLDSKRKIFSSSWSNDFEPVATIDRLYRCLLYTSPSPRDS